MTETQQIDLHEQLLAFGQAFKRAYEEAGLSKRAVSAAVPLDRSAIGRIERGLRGPHFETMLKMARAARSTPSALLGGGLERRREGPQAQSAGALSAAGGEAPDTQGSVEEAAKRLAENLRLAREALEEGMTQEDLAFYAKVDRSSVSGYETGRVAPSVPTLFKLAETLGVEAGALVAGVGLEETSDG